MPNFSEDYDAIGFDADHCLVKYDVGEVTRLIIKGGLEDLHEYCGYPEEIMDFDLNEESEEIQACLNYGVFDIDRGLLIKLGEGKEVLAALKGRRVLTQEEIEDIYGSPVPRFEAMDWPNLHSFPETQGANYWTFATYFDACKAPQVLMAVELIDAGKVDKTYHALSRDMRWTIIR